MKIVYANFSCSLLLMMGLALTGCSEKKESQKISSKLLRNLPSPQPVSESSTTTQRNAFDHESVKKVVMASLNGALDPLKHGADLLGTIRAGWNKFEHQSFAALVAPEMIRAALFDSPEAFLKVTRSTEIDASLRTALVGRLSLLSAYLGEGGEGEGKPIRVLSILSDAISHAQPTEGDAISIRVLKCAAQLRATTNAVPDSEFQTWMEFSKSPNVAARAMAIISMQLIEETAAQQASLLGAFDSEENPDVQRLLLQYLAKQPSDEAAESLKKFREKWPASDDTVKVN